MQISNFVACLRRSLGLVIVQSFLVIPDRVVAQGLLVITRFRYTETAHICKLDVYRGSLDNRTVGLLYQGKPRYYREFEDRRASNKPAYDPTTADPSHTCPLACATRGDLRHWITQCPPVQLEMQHVFPDAYTPPRSLWSYFNESKDMHVLSSQVHTLFTLLQKAV